MADKRAASQLSFGMDLRKQAVQHISFLKTVDGVPELKRPQFLKRAVYRYEKYWLPLAADHLKECLAAPLDIEWVWHCHMLCPVAYENDCNAIVGTTVNHRLFDAKQYQEKQKQTQRYWYAKYDGDHEPFMVDFTAPYDIKTVENYKTKITYDLVAAAQRQVVFYYQVSLPHHKDKKYLDNSVLRYKQFLYLKKHLPKVFLVPCYDIDLIWHTHQLNPLTYKEDMLKIIGCLVNHDDTVNDRSVGSKLYNSDKETREQWKTFYNENFPLFGAMYRGNPPSGFLYKITPGEAHMFSTKNTTVSIERLALSFPSCDRDRFKKIKLIVTSTTGIKIFEMWHQLKRTYAQRSDESVITWTHVGHFTFDTGVASNIGFWLQEYIGRGFCSSKSDVGSNVLNMLPQIESSTSARTGGQIQAQLPLESNVTLDIQGRFSPPERGKALFFLVLGKYETEIILENVQHFLGPVALERLPPGTDNHCQVASHRLKNHLGNVDFTVRTIHSQPLMMSVIQVYYHNKMSAISHLVASDQLPLPTQVSRDEITLNPRQGERAVLIKNYIGDWGIITGSWKGFRRGVAGSKYERGIPGSPGTLFLKFFKFSTGRTVEVELGYLTEKYILRLDSALIDLMKGILHINSASTEVAEHIALAFSVSLLHVLCVPRPKGWREGQRLEPSITSRGSRPITIIPSDKMAFVMAAGLLWATPSNYFMKTNYDTSICAMCGREFGDVTEFDSGDHENLSGGDAGCDGCACGDGGDGGGDCGGGCGGCGGWGIDEQGAYCG